MATKGLNKVMLIGNVGKIDARQTRDGGLVVNIQLATSEKYLDKKIGMTQEKTEWHRVTIFGKLAEIAEKYVTKGSMIYIEGSNRTTSYDKEGQKHYSTEVVAQYMQMLNTRTSPQEQPQAEPDDAQPQFDDDIPF